VIEAPDALRPGTLADLLEDRLPKPVEDEAAWPGEPDDEDGDEDEEEDLDPDDDQEGPFASLDDD